MRSRSDQGWPAGWVSGRSTWKVPSGMNRPRGIIGTGTLGGLSPRSSTTRVLVAPAPGPAGTCRSAAPGDGCVGTALRFMASTENCRSPSPAPFAVSSPVRHHRGPQAVSGPSPTSAHSSRNGATGRSSGPSRTISRLGQAGPHPSVGQDVERPVRADAGLGDRVGVAGGPVEGVDRRGAAAEAGDGDRRGEEDPPDRVSGHAEPPTPHRRPSGSGATGGQSVPDASPLPSAPDGSRRHRAGSLPEGARRVHGTPAVAASRPGDGRQCHRSHRIRPDQGRS